MALETFPTTVYLNYPILKVPKFDTRIVSFGNKVEQRLQMNSAAQYRFICNINLNAPAAAYTVLQFFINRKGKFEAFYFRNPEDGERAATWTVNTAKAVGDIVVPTVANGRYYICTVAGTTHAATQPTWPTTEGGTVSDGTVTWKENSYTVRFDEDEQNLELFQYQLYNNGQFTLVEVSA